MDIDAALGLALKRVRKAKGLSQEDFSEVSSRTYISSLERGLKSPTLGKLQELCKVLGIHPATLLIMALAEDSKNFAVLCAVEAELNEIQGKHGALPGDVGA